VTDDKHKHALPAMPVRHPEGRAVTRGGAGRGQGRKPIKAGDVTVTVSLRLTTAQRAKLEALGGAAWVRERIDRAKTPNSR